MPMVTLRGSIQNVLFCRTDESLLQQIIPQNAGFSFGLGGTASSAKQALNVLGELITMPGLAAVLPGDGKYCLQTTLNAPVFSPFNVHFPGMETCILHKLHTPDLSSSITVKALWTDILHRAAGIEDDPVLVGAASFVQFTALRGTFLRKPPILRNAPPNNLTISDSSVHKEWFAVSPDGGAEGKLGLMIGLAFLPQTTRAKDLNHRDRHIFYRHPEAQIASGEMMIHQHVLLMENVELPPEGMSAGDAARLWLLKGRPADVKHVLDDSLISHALTAFQAFSDIHLE